MPRSYLLGPAAGSHVSCTHITSGRSFRRRYSNSASLSCDLRSLPSSEFAFQVTKLSGSRPRVWAIDAPVPPPAPASPTLGRLPGPGAAGWKNRFMRYVGTPEAGLNRPELASRRQARPDVRRRFSTEQITSVCLLCGEVSR